MTININQLFSQYLKGELRAKQNFEAYQVEQEIEDLKNRKGVIIIE